MQKLSKGVAAPSCQVVPVGKQQTQLLTLLAGRSTALYFLRDYACVLAQAELKRLVQEKPLFDAAGVQLVAVLDSDATLLDTVSALRQLPFAVISSESGCLYDLYGVGCAADKESLGDTGTMQSIAEAKAAGFSHGKDTGSPLRLPAVFLIGVDGRIQKAYYGRLADDVPLPTQLLT